MATKDMVGYIGVVDVTPASGRRLARRWEVSLHYRDPDIKSIRNVSCVDSKHSIKHNWMCSSWMGV